MTQNKTRKLKILVVDDDQDVLTVTTALLEEDGHQVLSASGALEALRLLESHKDIALLFTDIVLPGPMDGFELAAAARTIRPGLHVLYTSGYLKDDHVWEGTLLPKPWTQQDLKRAMTEVWPKWRAERRPLR